MSQLQIELPDRLAGAIKNRGVTETEVNKLVVEWLEHWIATQSTPAPWADWLERNQALSRRILNRRGGRMIDVDALLDSTRSDLEARDDDYLGR